MIAPMMTLTDDDMAILAAFRHDLHRNPELSGQEHRTSQCIREFLINLSACHLVDMPIETGVVARIPGSQTEIMLRADIDALPQTECVRVPWKSTVSGAMHACGHDIHTTALCGAALLLSRIKQAGTELPTIDLVFQPAEETGEGALQLIDAGLFQRIHPQVCFGLHNWPSVEIGNVVCRSGALMAAVVDLDIVIRGCGGHGSMPHLNVDPIVCAATLVQSLQTIVSRNVNPLEDGLLSINMIEGGTPVNRVADEVRMKATVRSLSDDVLDRMIERVDAIVECTARAYECHGEVLWGRRAPAVWNAPDLLEAARGAVQRSGCSLVDAAPTLVGEDFAYYQAHVPSFFFFVGSKEHDSDEYELHAPGFFAPDSAIRPAASLYAACALQER